jgi:Glutathione S-transferase, N-terminal domain
MDPFLDRVAFLDRAYPTLVSSAQKRCCVSFVILNFAVTFLTELNCFLFTVHFSRWLRRQKIISRVSKLQSTGMHTLPLNIPNLSKLTVFHRLESSRAQRVLILLEELNLKYNIKTYHRSKDGLAGAELQDVHPLGKSPVVVLEAPDEKPLVLAESGAIVEYLVDHWGQHLVPKKTVPGKEGKVGGESEGWIRNRYFMHYAEGSLMGLLAIQAVMNSRFELLSPCSVFARRVCLVASNLTHISRHQKRPRTLLHQAHHPDDHR